MSRPTLAAGSLVLLLTSSLLIGPQARAQAADSLLCQQATKAAEHSAGVPDQLLDAISRVESGRYNPDRNKIEAWPWTINAAGKGYFYSSKQQAVLAARQFRDRGIQSIDVGCAQINLMYHPDAFSSLDEAFDPIHNTSFAAHFLTELFHQAGSWPHAAAAYHSQTPELGTDYQRRVLEAWAEPIAPRQPASSEARWTPSRPSSIPRRAADGSQASDQSRQRPAAAPAPAEGTPFGRTGSSLSLRRENIRAARAIFSKNGRDLAAYRAMPIAMLAPPGRRARD